MKPATEFNQRLYDAGARKVAVFALGKLGCIPQQLAAYGASDGSSCVETSNNVVKSFNEYLKILIHYLNSNLADAKFVYTQDTSDSESYGMLSYFGYPIKLINTTKQGWMIGWCWFCR